MTQKKHADRPEVLKIGLHYYAVDWLTHGEWDARHDTAQDGMTDASKHLIEIRLHEQVGESHYQQVLWHEVQHAVWNAVQINLQPKWSEGDEDDVEERVIVTTSPLFVGVLQDNPALIAYLVSPGGTRR